MNGLGGNHRGGGAQRCASTERFPTPPSGVASGVRARGDELGGRDDRRERTLVLRSQPGFDLADRRETEERLVTILEQLPEPCHGRWIPPEGGDEERRVKHHPPQTPRVRPRAPP